MGFLISFAIAVLAGLGIGSGGLYLVYLDIFTDTPQKEAQGLNLAFFVFALLLSVVFHLLRGTYQSRRFLASLPLTVLGAVTGSLLAGAVAPERLRAGLGLLFLLSGLYTLFRLYKQYMQKRRTKIRKKT